MKSDNHTIKSKRVALIAACTNEKPQDNERTTKKAKWTSNVENVFSSGELRHELEASSNQLNFSNFTNKTYSKLQLSAALPNSLWCNDIDSVDAEFLLKQPLHYLDESNSPAMVSTCAIELYDNFNIQESEDRVDPQYFRRQPFVTVERRAKLVNVMVSQLYTHRFCE